MNLQDFIVSPNLTVLEVMKVINNNTKGIAFVCDNDILSAVVTDGDIRRHILKNGDLNVPIKNIANNFPIYVTNGKSIDYDAYMKKNSITALPILNKDKKIQTIRFLYDDKTLKNTKLNVPVVIMAGGKGTRLYPYTQILPKPLIPIGDRTITEIIMDHFEAYGCRHFDMILNYKKNFIKSFFIDNEKKRDVSFIEEPDFMGTGGGLKLLEGRYQDTFFVTNCDILIEEDYSDIIKYHKEQQNIITIVSAMKKTIIPYGTIELSEEGQVTKLNEKPSFSFLTNTGLYVLEPKFIERIPKDTFIHITDVIQECIDKGEKVGVYPISEHAWMDMGQMDELEKMRERLSVDVKL
ncbi:MAG TPA: nucleotidyltransferase family protein [Mobilitalea sp.]|nr:nucleotidyltransferase family protein [Mobilitalea sp.]